ncbi:MAG: hypothetical protein KJO07_06180 [Deltaproteobacteria bacterium]|nr:hypothetical protein [Deltaproteobacteria bacterium]
MKTTQPLAWLLALGLATVPACIGDVDDGSSEEEEEPVEEPVEEEPAPTATSVSGMVSDYFFLALGQTPQAIQAEATVGTMGLDPALSASTVEGAYSFEAVPVTARVNFMITVANFRPTYSAELLVGDTPIEDHMLWAVSEAYMAGNFGAIPETVDPLAGEVIAHLHRNNGEPFDALTIDQVTLIDPAAPGIPVAVPTYFFGDTGYLDIDQLTTDSTIDPSGVARVGLVNVPPGSYELTITYLNGQLEEMTQVTPVMVTADSVTLVTTGGGGDGPGAGDGMGTPERQPPPDGLYGFVEDIYPILQKTTISPAGDGCANCHWASGNIAAAAVIEFNLPAADVHAALLAERIVGEVNVPLVAPNDSANSPLLIAPSLLIEEPLLLIEHPTKIWSATPGDFFYPSYLAVQTWIDQGAPLTRADNLTEPVILE